MPTRLLSALALAVMLPLSAAAQYTTVVNDATVLTKRYKLRCAPPLICADQGAKNQTILRLGSGDNVLTLAGLATFNGGVILGDTAADDITVNGSLASDLLFKTGLSGGADISVATGAANTAGSSLDFTGATGGAAATDGDGKAGGVVSITGGAGSALDGGGTNDGDGADVVLLGGARGGATGSAVHGIVRVGTPTVGSTKATNLLAVGGAFEVDGAARFDGAVSLLSATTTLAAGVSLTATTGTATVGRSTSGAVTITSADDDADADLILDAGGSGLLSFAGPVATTNANTCTLNGASPSVCTATVKASSICTCSNVGATAAIAANGCAVGLSGTTLTVTSANSASNVVNILCF